MLGVDGVLVCELLQLGIDPGVVASDRAAPEADELGDGVGAPS